MISRNAFLIYMLLISATTIYLSKFPGHNGDMPFYISLVLEKEQGSMEGVVEQTKQILQKELPAREFQDHADRIMLADPAIFERYRVKPLYVLLVLALHRLGFSYIHSTLVPSLLCYFLIAISIWQIVIQRMEPVKTMLVCLVCMLILPTMMLARLSSPDALSCFILLNGVALIYSGRNKSLWFSLFLLAICTRLDNVVSELIFLFALWKWPDGAFANKLSTKEFITMSLFLVGMALFLNLTATHHFLWFMDPAFSQKPGQYLNDIGIYFSVIPGSFFMYLLVLFIISGLNRGFSWKRDVNYIFYTVCAIVAIRFVLYPFYEERYITPYLLFSLLTLSFYYAGQENRPKAGPVRGS